MRAGEAKLCVRVRRASLTLGLGVAASARFRAVWRAIFAAIWMVLSTFDDIYYPRALFLLTGAWVLRKSKTQHTIFAWVVSGETQKQMQTSLFSLKTHANDTKCEQSK